MASEVHDGRSQLVRLRELAALIRRVEGEVPRVPEPETGSVVVTGWDEIDRLLAGQEGEPGVARGGLARGVLHEWIGVGEAADPPYIAGGFESAGGTWAPPLSLAVHLALQALKRSSAGSIAWIGRRIWPHPPALAGTDPELLARSVFVDPPDEQGRLWAADLALRSPAFAAVIADGSATKMPHTRRLQLAAAGGGALGLLLRPPAERGELSAAATRWLVSWMVAGRGARAGPRWRVDLVRCKGGQSAVDQGGPFPRSWLMEQDRGQGAVRVLAELADRSDSAAAAADEQPQRAVGA